MYDEPNHPALQKYEKAHTKKWSSSVAAADAYAFVTPEYNYGPPPSFVNALNFVYKEWNYKPWIAVLATLNISAQTAFCGYCRSYCNVISDLSEFLGTSADKKKSPRALILKGFLIFPGLSGTLLDYPDGGEVGVAVVGEARG